MKKFLLALAALVFSFSAAYQTHAAEAQMVATLNPVQYTVTIPGDSLIRVSKRFSVSPESVLAMNPQVAARTDSARRYWIYLGETLSVPVYQMKVVSDAEVGDSALVATTMSAVREAEDSLRVAETRVAELNTAFEKTTEKLGVAEMELYLTSMETETLTQNVTAAKTKIVALENTSNALQKENRSLKNLFILLAIIATAAVALAVLSIKKNSGAAATASPKTKSAHKSCCDKEKTTPLSDAEETQLLLKELQMADGKTLAELADMEIARDECGNPITIKKIADFMNNSKRSDLPLKDRPVNEWPQILAAAKSQNQPADGAVEKS